MRTGDVPTPKTGTQHPVSHGRTTANIQSRSNTERLPLEQGLEHLRYGRWDQAIFDLRLALQREPGRFAALRALASACVHYGDVDGARTAIAKFMVENPMNAQGWQLAAQLEWKHHRHQRAVEILDSGLKRLPGDSTLHRQQAMFLAALGKLDQAAEHTRQTSPSPAHQQPSLLESYLTAATTASGRPRQLLRSADPAGESVHGSDNDWLDQVAQDPVLLDALLRFDQESLADSPMTLPEEQRKFMVEIERKLAALLTAQCHHADRQLLLGRLQTMLGDYPSALLAVQRALRANPKLTAAHRLRAVIHARIGEPQRAIEILQHLLKEGLAWPDIHYEIAELERKRGSDNLARGHLYNAVALNSDFQQARELLDQCNAA